MEITTDSNKKIKQIFYWGDEDPYPHVGDEWMVIYKTSPEEVDGDSFSGCLFCIPKDAEQRKINVSTPPKMELRYADGGNIALYKGDATSLDAIAGNSVNLIVTSPPYNVGVEYDGYVDNKPFSEYWDFTARWMREAYRVLAPSGRIVLNVPNTGNGKHKKKGDKYIPFLVYAIQAVEAAGFTMREVITWIKSSADEAIDSEENFSMGNTAWGSWLSPSNPSCRSLSEFIIVAHKGSPRLEWKGETDLEREEFMKKMTRNVWVMPAGRYKGHPAPFPTELPRRAIKLYCYIGDVVFDPFLGSGTTARVAKDLKRRFIGVDQSDAYLDMAIERLKED